MSDRMRKALAALGLMALSACGQSGVEVQVDPDPPSFRAIWPTTTIVPGVVELLYATGDE